jgi:hypothetical protein
MTNVLGSIPLALMLNSAAASALLAAAGAFAGLATSAVAARQVLRRREAEMFEQELAEQLYQLRGTERASGTIERAVERQELMVLEARHVRRSEYALRRLLLGYVVLLTTGLTFGLIGILISNVSIRATAVAWFVAALAGTAVLTGVLFLIAQSRRIYFPPGQSMTALVAPLSPLPARRAALEKRVLGWLDEQGWTRRSELPADRGFDLLAERDGETLLVEIKAGSPIRIKDVDALLGAAVRFRANAPGSSVRIALIAPDETLSEAQVAALIAAEEGIELYAVTASGTVERWKAHTPQQ